MLISQKKNKTAALALLLSMFSTVSHADCLGMQVHAHRGTGDAPENSLSALRNAYFGTWDGVETDLQLLADGNWVAYHDLLTGRVVDTGQPRAVRQMDSDDWRVARMKNHGALTAETPPFVADIADLATAFPEKTLNAEIKDGVPSCAPVESLVAQLRSNIKHGNWFLTSSVPNNLVCARRADPQGYLACREGGSSAQAGQSLAAAHAAADRHAYRRAHRCTQPGRQSAFAGRRRQSGHARLRVRRRWRLGPGRLLAARTKTQPPLAQRRDTQR